MTAEHSGGFGLKDGVAATCLIAGVENDIEGVEAEEQVKGRSNTSEGGQKFACLLGGPAASGESKQTARGPEVEVREDRSYSSTRNCGAKQEFMIAPSKCYSVDK